jgi:CDP-glucose 4,6-dehydratase
MVSRPPGVFDARRVFVTGATGIVGGWLVRRLLQDGADVVALVRDLPAQSEIVRNGDIERVTRVHGALEDPRLLRRVLVEYDVSVVFHLAAQTQVTLGESDPFGTVEANVRGSYNLLEAARSVQHPPALVIASSDKAYGESTNLPYTEHHPLAGRSIYDASKSAADLLASAYARSYKMPLAIARCGNIYGGGDLNWDRIVPGTIRSLLRGQRPVVRSDGTPQRDYLFVLDAVDAYLRLGTGLIAGELAGEAFNFGANKPVAVLDVVRALQRVMERPDLEPEILGGAGGEIPNQYLDASKAERMLDWKPRYGLDEGLARTVDWYRLLFA